MSARFEVVRTNAEQPWHARLIAANGSVVWTTEQYGRRRAAFRAIDLLYQEIIKEDEGDLHAALLEVREVDERTFPPLGDVL